LGPLSLFGIAFLSAVSIADILLNDITPGGYWFACSRNLRHVGYMATAIVLVYLSGVIFFHAGFTLALLSLWMPALFCVAIVPLDIQARRPR
jgi:hypothetical protein